MSNTETLFQGKAQEPIVIDYWTIFPLALLFVFLVLPKIKKAMRSDAYFIKAATLFDYIKNEKDFLLIDIRNPNEFNGPLGHVSCAVNIPFNKLESKLDNLAPKIENFKYSHIVLMSRSDSKAYKAFKMMKKEGFARVEILEGGIKNWTINGFRTVRKSLK